MFESHSRVRYMKGLKRLALSILLLSGVLSGCSSNVTLQSPTIPQPLLEKIPISVGLRMPKNFEHFVHKESIYGREEWSIDLGRSNADFFTQLMNYMFESVTILGPTDDIEAAGIDALIEPSIDAFEFSTPAQSHTDAFAVWIRYRLKVYDREGTLISNWPVSAYGKSQATKMGNAKSLQRAAVLAMRDAAALMIMKFDSVTRISSLANHSATPPAPDEIRSHEVRSTETEGIKDDAS